MTLRYETGDNGTILLETVSDGIIRVRMGNDFSQSISERYSIVNANPDAGFSARVDGNTLTAGPLSLTIDSVNHQLIMRADGITSTITLMGWGESASREWQERGAWLKGRLEHWYDKVSNDSQHLDSQNGNNIEVHSSVRDVPPFGAAFSITGEDRIYGFGEAAEEYLVYNGKSVLNRVLYQKNEVPIPLAMSSRGWGVFFNTAWWHGTDIGAREQDQMYFYGDHGAIDFFVLYAGSLHGITQKYTRLTGAPCVLPKWMYGLSYIANYHARNFDVLQDARDFRREDIPCDMISLEPGWMQNEYDSSTSKDWSEQKFMVRDWMRTPDKDREKNYPGTFVSVLRRYGFKLSLWLNCIHDFTPEEERRAGNDTDFGIEPWFDHLKRFVNEGVDGFKVDPAHYTDKSDPQKVYANGMSDPQIHNLLQTVLSKQMHLGFEEHTGRRPMHHFCGGYSGIQRWGATTCGDSGGGKKSLGWIINLGMHGHPNMSCDMDLHTKERMHYAMFTAWPLLDSWAGFFQPWYAGDDIEAMFREYVKLRYRIAPYSYSAALEAHLSSMPLVRSMPLVYPEVSETWDSITQYMYGPSMLISSFSDRIYLPTGKWLDMWTNEEYAGGSWIDYEVPENRGGGFFLKGGAIVPTWGPRNYITGADEEHMELLLYPEGESRYTLYEDDGVTNKYQGGEIASTLIEVSEDAAGIKVSIHPRQGNFDGMKSARDWKITVICQAASPTVFVNGVATACTVEEGKVIFRMPGADSEASSAILQVKG